ncbi:MAG TPA: hypothetical protein VHE61_20360 [Opitutaceae bacterium]|nr:hypothetical protein [Opitutaceae bacterium]
MRLALPPSDEQPLPAEPPAPVPRSTRYFIAGLAGALMLVLWNGLALAPARPPFCPAMFLFNDCGDRIGAEGCFVGPAAMSAINEQRIHVDVTKGTVELDSISVLHFDHDRNLLNRSTEQYRIVADDGDRITATLKFPNNPGLFTLQISRKQHTVSASEHFPGLPVRVAELKDGPTVYHRLVATRCSWFEAKVN